MTKAKTLNEFISVPPKAPKPIEFVKLVILYDKESSYTNPSVHPSAWENIILLRPKSNACSYDLMIAFDDNDMINSKLYLGHWNDGVVNS